MLFFCYAREDKFRVRPIIDALTVRGISVWWDEGSIPPGELWEEEIREAIEKADHFVPCISANFLNKSDSFVQEELDLANRVGQLRASALRWLIPLQLDTSHPPNLHVGRHSISDVHAITFKDSSAEYAEALVEIVHADAIHQGVRNDPISELKYASGMIRDGIMTGSNYIQEWLCEGRLFGKNGFEINFFKYTDGFFGYKKRPNKIYRVYGEIIFTKHECFFVTNDKNNQILCEINLENSDDSASFSLSLYLPFIGNEVRVYGSKIQCYKETC